jgi:hypothetical protein
MELSQKEKDRIIEEEKLRLETRKEYLKDNLEGMGCGNKFGGGCGCGCHHRCGHWGFLKGIIWLVVIVALFHFWRWSPGCGSNGYCPSAQPQAPAAMAPQMPAKK